MASWPGLLLGALGLLIGKLFSEMFESNKAIYEKLGTGGLFAGGLPPAQVFSNIMRNLTPDPNVYGQTYQKNLEMAEVITKLGYSAGSLAETGNVLGRNIIGLAGGKAGQGLAATVYGGAKFDFLPP